MPAQPRYLTVTPEPDDPERIRLYRYETVQDLLSISQRFVYDLVKAGELDAVTLGTRTKRITALSVADYLERARR